MKRRIFNFIILLFLFLLPSQAQENYPVLEEGMKFLGKPYVAHVLDRGNTEQLIVNTNELDCTTFVEYAVAKALCQRVLNPVESFPYFVRDLRYRGGVVDGYPSRLHYFTEWIQNGINKGYLEDVTYMHSSDSLEINLNFMSSYPDYYRPLVRNPQDISVIREQEKALSGQYVRWLPKRELPHEGLHWIQNGDIIALTVKIPGLDVSHVGIATYVRGELRLLHASSSKGKVVIENKSLRQMLDDSKNWTGIRVIRLI